MSIRPATFRSRLALLTVSAALLAACTDDTLRVVAPPGARIDTFNQVAVGKVDVLFVIDNSQSTEDKQENLARNIQGFFSFLQEAKVDYHIGVTTSDVASTAPGAQGSLFGTPAVITPQTPNPVEAFARNARVGTGGSGNEAGLDAARRTLVLNPSGFLRPDAYLFIIFVSDDEDHSEPGVPRFFYRFFEQSKGRGNEGMVSAGAIVGDAPNGCLIPSGVGSCTSPDGCQARAGLRYKEVVDLVGGRVGSICDPQFDVILKELGVDAVGLKRKWPLSKGADEKTIEVSVKYPCDTPASRLTACTKVTESCGGASGAKLCVVKKRGEGEVDGWSYEAATNSIIFHGNTLPPKSAEIDIQYFEPGMAPE